MSLMMSILHLVAGCLAQRHEGTANNAASDVYGGGTGRVAGVCAEGDVCGGGVGAEAAGAEAVCACGGVQRRRRVAGALGTEAMHQRSSEQTWPGLIGSGSAIFMWSASGNALNLP